MFLGKHVWGQGHVSRKDWSWPHCSPLPDLETLDWHGLSSWGVYRMSAQPPTGRFPSAKPEDLLLRQLKKTLEP